VNELTAWHAIRRRPGASAGVALLGTFVLVAILAPLLEPYGLDSQVGPVFGHPSSAHPLGLDDAGVDVVSLLIGGDRISLLVGVSAMLVSTLVGGAVGVLSGYLGGATDLILMRVTDYFLVVPYLPLMIVIAALWGPSLLHIVLVIGLLQWTYTARLVRAQVKSLRERVYVQRVRSLGASRTRVVVRHILPQLGPLLIAASVLSISYAVFSETALSFLGLGDPTQVSWGSIIGHAFQHSAISSGAWWAVVPAGLCVALLVTGCYLAGRSVEEALNPRLQGAHLSVRRFGIRSRRGESG
jgi:peptide/nickel transport system permease protein